MSHASGSAGAHVPRSALQGNFSWTALPIPFILGCGVSRESFRGLATGLDQRRHDPHLCHGAAVPERLMIWFSLQSARQTFESSYILGSFLAKILQTKAFACRLFLENQSAHEATTKKGGLKTACLAPQAASGSRW